MRKKIKILFCFLFVLILAGCKMQENAFPAQSLEAESPEGEFSENSMKDLEDKSAELSDEKSPEISPEQDIENPAEKSTAEAGDEAWIESAEEQNAGKWKSNGEVEVSIVRTSKPVLSEAGEVLGNAYYDRPVVSGDSEAAKKINRFFEQEERDWLEGDAGRLTEHEKDCYLRFSEHVKDMCERYGEAEVTFQPLRYAIDSRIMFLSDNLLSILQIENYFTEHCYWHYYGSTFDLKTGELLPMDALVDMTPSKMKEIVREAGEMYDALEGDSYEIYYGAGNHGYTIAMNYEYYYDGNHYFIIVNQGNRPGIIQTDGEIRDWNGEWGDQLEVITFQYRVDLENEKWKKDVW